MRIYIYIMSIYILDQTTGESYDYSYEKYNELKAFMHDITLCSIRVKDGKFISEVISPEELKNIPEQL